MPKRTLKSKVNLRHKEWSRKEASELPGWISEKSDDDLVFMELSRTEDYEGLCVYDEHLLFAPWAGKTLRDLDTVIHEILHACTELNEEAVKETAASIARVLWDDGWRRDNKPVDND